MAPGRGGRAGRGGRGRGTRVVPPDRRHQDEGVTSPGLLADLERYYDTAPRAACDTEELGPLTLFLPRSGFPYYARPRLGLAGEVTAADVTAVLARQRELDVPRAVEWVHDTTPSLLAAAREAGMTVEECPLLGPRAGTARARSGRRRPDRRGRRPGAGTGPRRDQRGVRHVGNQHRRGLGRRARRRRGAHPETAERIAALITAGLGHPGRRVRRRGRAGRRRQPQPARDVTEIVGVGVLPAYRRRGLAAAITARLARHALDNGVRTVFCSAQDDAVAHVYESVGFRRVGTACVAEAD